MAHADHIHPSAFIGDDVVLGEDVAVGPGAVLLGPLTVGNRVWIGPNAVVGTPPEMSNLPQNAAWNGDSEHAGVEIGDDVVIRELATIHQGSQRTTRIGSGTWILNSAYAAHDVQVGSNVTVSAGVRLGGHVVVGDHANVGMNASVHQRRIIGAGAMIGMATPVTRDVPPFAKAYGSPLRVRGVNAYILTRLGASTETMARITAALESDDPRFDDLETDPVIGAWIRSWLDHHPCRVALVRAES
jgi:UDP-N-acetylglucosamine acyltransferase